MQGPTRIYLSLRHHADAGLVAAVAASTLLFAATPLLLPEIASEYGVQLGVAGLVSTAQVGTFAVVVFVAGRTLRTHRRYLIFAALVTSAANLASTVAPTFSVLVAFRMVAGGAAGIMVWLGWAKAMRVGASFRNVAAAGPAAVLLGAPVIGWFSSSFGIDAVFTPTSLPAVATTMMPRSTAFLMASCRPEKPYPPSDMEMTSQDVPNRRSWRRTKVTRVTQWG